MGLRSVSLAVVGADHPNKRGPTRRFEIAVTKPGTPLELRPEPKNPADEFAIAVFSERGNQLGYLTAERAPWIGRILARGVDVHAIMQQATPYGAVIRVAFAGERPTLPSSVERIEVERFAIDEGGFYPDEIPPDE